MLFWLGKSSFSLEKDAEGWYFNANEKGNIITYASDCNQQVFLKDIR